MKFLLLLPFIFAFQMAFCQSKNTEFNKVNEVYGENYAENLSTSNPGKLSILLKYASTGFIVLNGNIKTKGVVKINEVPLHSKGEAVSIVEFLSILESEKYNPLIFEWIPGIQPQTFQLGDTDYFICIPSQNQLERI